MPGVFFVCFVLFLLVSFVFFLLFLLSGCFFFHNIATSKQERMFCFLLHSIPRTMRRSGTSLFRQNKKMDSLKRKTLRQTGHCLPKKQYCKNRHVHRISIANSNQRSQEKKVQSVNIISYFTSYEHIGLTKPFLWRFIVGLIDSYCSSLTDQNYWCFQRKLPVFSQLKYHVEQLFSFHSGSVRILHQGGSHEIYEYWKHLMTDVLLCSD